LKSPKKKVNKKIESILTAKLSNSTKQMILGQSYV